MRVPLFFGLFLLAAGAIAASEKTSPEVALRQMQADARADGLIDLAAEDIKAKRFDAALRRADEAARLRPGDSVILNTRGAALVELRRFDEARTALEAAIEADPQSFAPRYNLGEILTLEKKPADAAVLYTVLESRFGSLPLLKFKLYLCYRQAGQTDRARERLDSLRYPEDGPAWYFAHATDLLQSGRRGDAQRLIAAATAIHGDEAQTYRRALEDAGLLK